MVYSDPSNNDIQFSVLNNTGPRVIVEYNNSGIHYTTGPVPFIKISETPNVTENGEMFSSKVSINLNGKILSTGVGGGVSGIINKINQLRGLFYGSGALSAINYNNVLKVKCDNSTRFEIGALKVVGFSASQTPDNWTVSADYSIDLEAYLPKYSGNFAIKSANDDWTIEPLEDRAYYVNSSSVLGGISGVAEHHNPQLGSSPSATRVVSKGISLVTLPQYKVTRNISAIGFATGYADPFTAHQNARNWVESRIYLTFYGGSTVQKPYITFNGTLNNNTSSNQFYLYNHLRTINFSINEGSYEVNETWLAMPTGVPFIEDYTVESATDIKNIKTVRVQGNIKGLVLANSDLETLNDMRYLSPTSGTNNINPSSGIGAEPREQSTTTFYKQDFTSSSLNHNNKIEKHQYVNALSGWIYDIKPFLYARACIVVDSYDRNAANYPHNLNQFDTTISNPNIMFSKERLLNTSPISCSEEHDPRHGTINYNYEYNNRFTHLSGVISETVRINDNGPADVINEAFVLGRRLGPALQNLGSRTSSRKEVSIEISVVPPWSIAGFVLNNKECPLYTGGAVFSGISGMIKDFRPFSSTRSAGLFAGDAVGCNTGGVSYVSSDTTTWDPIGGRFTRNVAWIYQHCRLVYNTLDS